MSAFDPLDFQPNSTGAPVVRVIRLEDIKRTLSCTESQALEVMREMRGTTSGARWRLFVLPSQLAAWAYRQARKDPASPTTQHGSPALRPASPKLILSQREAARMLGVGRNKTLHDLIARRLLRTVVVNGRVKVPRAEVERIVREGLDLDAPRMAQRPRPPKRGGQEVVTAIRRLKL